ncbi:hypothetical protein COW46_00905 [Candidatus Gracilibacteria bacterium CG17_big_fil_post_rev_8_21_14_2_50_48_13]|nr:MAG: hypothetical protein COW46_00905 [Candidatus Gracilibacteria bacterium CG17_big_fil_post_rev_8_21_14_2_50_48_13]
MNNARHYAYMKDCIELSRRSLERGQAPFATIIVQENQVIASAMNNAANIPSEHAEVLALNLAMKKVGGKLQGATLYTNCEPCPMCAFMIREYGIETVVYAIPSPFMGGHSKYKILEDKELDTFDNFFAPSPTVIAGFMESEAMQVFRTFTPLWMFGSHAKREQRLRELCLQTMHSDAFQGQYSLLLPTLQLTEDEVLQAYANYDMNVFAYDNSIYGSLSLRFALFLHYFLQGSWHQVRQKTVLEYLNEIHAERIADMGFGAPTQYLFDYVLQQKKSAILVDFYDSAFAFAKVALALRDGGYQRYIAMEKLDMNEHAFPSGQDCYLFQDSLEHVRAPKTYLMKVVQEVARGTYFIFSLPIGPLIPSHTMSWASLEEILQWLEDCGLTIIRAEKSWLNPEVDLFVADSSLFHWGLILARK